MIYSDTNSDYETALIVTRMDSLKDRCEMLMAKFFKKQVLASNALLHYLWREPRDDDRGHRQLDSKTKKKNSNTIEIPKYCLTYLNTLKHYVQVTWLPSPRSEAQVHVCLPVRDALLSVITTLYYVVLFFILKRGIASFLCAVCVFELGASSSFPRLPLCQILSLSRPPLLN